MNQTSHYQQMLRLVSRIGRLVNPQHLPLLTRPQVSQAQFLVLDGLDEKGGAMRMSELARAAGLSDSELTRVVGDLIARKWIGRAVDPDDARSRLVKITPAGARTIRDAHAQASAELRGVWSDFTHEEWHRFIDYLQRFEQGLRRVRGREDSGPTDKRKRRAVAGNEGQDHA